MYTTCSCVFLRNKHCRCIQLTQADVHAVIIIIPAIVIYSHMSVYSYACRRQWLLSACACELWQQGNMYKKHASKSHHKLLVVILLLSTSLNQGVSSAIQNLSVYYLWKVAIVGIPFTLTKIFLFFRAKNSVKHYPVRWDGQEFQFGFGRFTSVDELREHFASRPVIGGESGTTHGSCCYGSHVQ